MSIPDESANGSREENVILFGDFSIEETKAWLVEAEGLSIVLPARGTEHSHPTSAERLRQAQPWPTSGDSFGSDQGAGTHLQLQLQQQLQAHAQKEGELVAAQVLHNADEPVPSGSQGVPSVGHSQELKDQQADNRPLVAQRDIRQQQQATLQQQQQSQPPVALQPQPAPIIQQQLPQKLPRQAGDANQKLYKYNPLAPSFTPSHGPSSPLSDNSSVSSLNRSVESLQGHNPQNMQLQQQQQQQQQQQRHQQQQHPQHSHHGHAHSRPGYNGMHMQNGVGVDGPGMLNSGVVPSMAMFMPMPMQGLGMGDDGFRFSNHYNNGGHPHVHAQARAHAQAQAQARAHAQAQAHVHGRTMMSPQHQHRQQMQQQQQIQLQQQQHLQQHQQHPHQQHRHPHQQQHPHQHQQQQHQHQHQHQQHQQIQQMDEQQAQHHPHHHQAHLISTSAPIDSTDNLEKQLHTQDAAMDEGVSPVPDGSGDVLIDIPELPVFTEPMPVFTTHTHAATPIHHEPKSLEVVPIEVAVAPVDSSAAPQREKDAKAKAKTKSKSKAKTSRKLEEHVNIIMPSQADGGGSVVPISKKPTAHGDTLEKEVRGDIQASAVAKNLGGQHDEEVLSTVPQSATYTHPDAPGLSQSHTHTHTQAQTQTQRPQAPIEPQQPQAQVNSVHVEEQAPAQTQIDTSSHTAAQIPTDAQVQKLAQAQAQAQKSKQPQAQIQKPMLVCQTSVQAAAAPTETESKPPAVVKNAWGIPAQPRAQPRTQLPTQAHTAPLTQRQGHTPTQGHKTPSSDTHKPASHKAAGAQAHKVANGHAPGAPRTQSKTPTQPKSQWQTPSQTPARTNTQSHKEGRRKGAVNTAPPASTQPPSQPQPQPKNAPHSAAPAAAAPKAQPDPVRVGPPVNVWKMNPRALTPTVPTAAAPAAAKNAQAIRAKVKTQPAAITQAQPQPQPLAQGQASATAAETAAAPVGSVAADSTTAQHRTLEEERIPKPAETHAAEKAATADQPTTEQSAPSTPAKARAPPSSWSKLFAKPPTADGGIQGTPAPHSTVAAGANSSESLAEDVDTPLPTDIKRDNARTHTTCTSLSDVLVHYDIATAIPWSSLQYTSRGLINHTNMCFMHTILQTLLATPLFRQFLVDTQMTFPSLSAAKPKAAVPTPILDALTHFFKAFDVSNPSKRKFSTETQANGGRHNFIGESFQPLKLYEVIQRVRRQALGSQEDAEEFLSFVLDTLHEECLAVVKANNINASAGARNSADSMDGWEEVGKGNKKVVTHQSEFLSSPVTKIFGGTVRSSLKRAGSKASVTFQPFHSLQLEIATNDVHNLNDALRHLTLLEHLDGFTCETTNLAISADKQSRIETLPPVLVLHLKRFVYDPETGIRKLHKFVPYPLHLEISEDLLSTAPKSGKLKGIEREYRLFSVVYHHGEAAEGGHYTCDVRKPGTKLWNRCDDSKIEPISPDEATGGIEYLSTDQHGSLGTPQASNRPRSPLPSGKNRGDAYILFYERCDLETTMCPEPATAAQALKAVNSTGSSKATNSSSVCSSPAGAKENRSASSGMDTTQSVISHAGVSVTVNAGSNSGSAKHASQHNGPKK